MHLQLFAIDDDGHREAITHLYWFEERGVQSWEGDGWTGHYRFEILVNGVVVFDSGHPDATWEASAAR